MYNGLIESICEDIENLLKKTKLDSEIIEYCELNDIKNVNKFIYDCLLSGFNIVRYGSSPLDNIKRQKGESETVVVGDSEKKEPESKIIKKKRKIAIKSKD